MLLKCCLNGARSRSDHPACPTTPQELARDASAVAAAGAMALHVHPRDAEGIEALDGRSVGAAISAIRETVTVPVGVSTGAWILPEARDRLRAIEEWDVLPDFASVNFNESGEDRSRPGDPMRAIAYRGRTHVCVCRPGSSSRPRRCATSWATSGSCSASTRFSHRRTLVSAHPM
jgi:hypothetical protein